MPLNSDFDRSRRPLRHGNLVTGREGLEQIAISCEMSSDRPDRFRARVLTAAVGQVFVTRTKVQHLTAARQQAHVGDAYGGFMQLGFVLAGEVLVQQGDRRTVARAGEVMALNHSTPFTSSIVSAEVAHMYLPLSLLRQHRLPVGQMTGTALPASPFATAARRLLVGITDSSNALEPGNPFAGRALEDLALGMLFHLQQEAIPRATIRDSTLVRARTFIAAHFADPRLDVEAVADAMGTSRRYLESLFAEQSITVGGEIRAARLELARGLLAVRADLPIEAIGRAAGFRGADQFARAFRRAHGTPPSAYRAAAHRGEVEDG